MTLPRRTVLQEPVFTVRIFEGSCAMCLNATNIEAEIEAVRQGTFYLSDTNITCRNAVFLVDSQSMILSLCSTHCDSAQVEETKHRISELNCGGNHIPVDPQSL
ncbi:hypothetical protein CEXT_549961 [Caerostris extrusa]|uniref:Uncharacterized protein n=1 Tax=Caerostris extrusa TaxID=172846 RepID=A0AAV4S7I8_CAEEX|nr:hypothetical protein CEXT_549961 [Caerostris extrusa]